MGLPCSASTMFAKAQVNGSHAKTCFIAQESME